MAAAHVAGRLRWLRGLAACLWPCVLPTWPGFPSDTARAPRPPTLDSHGVVLCLWSRRYSQGQPPWLWCSVAEGL